MYREGASGGGAPRELREASARGVALAAERRAAHAVRHLHVRLQGGRPAPPAELLRAVRPAAPPRRAHQPCPPRLAPVPCSPASLLPCPLALLTRRGRLGSTPWHAAGRTLALSRSLAPSRHVFCNGCIQQWLDKNTSCPMCRTECAPPASPAPPEPSPTLLGRELGPSLFGLGSMLGGAMGGGPGGAQPIGMMASIGAPACSKVTPPLLPGRCPKCVPPPQRPPPCPPLPSPPPGRVY